MCAALTRIVLAYFCELLDAKVEGFEVSAKEGKEQEERMGDERSSRKVGQVFKFDFEFPN